MVTLKLSLISWKKVPMSIVKIMTNRHHCIGQVTCGHLKVVSHLLEKGANVNCEDHDKQTPLHLASYMMAILKLSLISWKKVPMSIVKIIIG